MVKATQAMHSRSSWEQFKAWLRGIKNALISLIKAFIQAIKDAMALIGQIFSFAVSFFSFIAKHPKIAIAVGSVAVLGVLGFVLRPYVSIASSIFGKGK